MEQREIKFRGWDGKRMWNQNDSGHTPFQDSEGCMPCQIIEVLSVNYGWKWMQYTGLLDDNGKEIYEGDIVLSHPEEDQKKWSDTKGVIVFHDTSYKIEIFSNHPTPPYCLITIFTPEHFGIGLEIIGNIYENPELLNQ